MRAVRPVRVAPAPALLAGSVIVTWHGLGILAVAIPCAVLAAAVVFLIGYGMQGRPPNPRTTGFLSVLLHLTTTAGAGRLFVVESPLRYAGRDRSQVWTVRAGFRTDLGSVPRAATWLQPTYGDVTPAFVLHDWLCAIARGDETDAQPISRRDADGLFRRVLRELGVAWARRWLLWGAVRAGSRCSGMTPAEAWRFALVAVAAVPLLLPAGPVFVWQLAWDGVERLTRPRGQ